MAATVRGASRRGTDEGTAMGPTGPVGEPVP